MSVTTNDLIYKLNIFFCVGKNTNTKRILFLNRCLLPFMEKNNYSIFCHQAGSIPRRQAGLVWPSSPMTRNIPRACSRVRWAWRWTVRVCFVRCECSKIAAHYESDLRVGKIAFSYPQKEYRTLFVLTWWCEFVGHDMLGLICITADISFICKRKKIVFTFTISGNNSYLSTLQRIIVVSASRLELD